MKPHFNGWCPREQYNFVCRLQGGASLVAVYPPKTMLIALARVEIKHPSQPRNIGFKASGAVDSLPRAGHRA